MIRPIPTTAAGALLLSVAFAASALELPDRLVIHHLTAVGPDGRSAGEYLHTHDNASTPPAEVGLLETEDGYRAHLRYVFDRDIGATTSRFLDLHSGWWLELHQDLGMRNLAGPEDFHDGSELIRGLNERLERERPTTTYTLTSSDGAYAEWSNAWEMPAAEAEAARTAALAAFAADLAGSDVPASALAELRLLSELIASPQPGSLDTFERLIEQTTAVLRATGAIATDSDEEVEVRFSMPAEAPDQTERLMKMFDADERWRERKRDHNGSPETG